MSSLFSILLFAFAWTGFVWAVAVLPIRHVSKAPSWSGYWGLHILLAGLVPMLAVAFFAVPDFQRPGFLPDIVSLPTRLDSVVEPVGVAVLDTKGWAGLVGRAPGVLMLLYSAGILWRLGRFCLQKIQLGVLVSKASPWAVQTARSPILMTSEAMTPFALGGRNPKIILPDTLAKSLEDNSLQTIIAHEQCHIDRRDPETGTLLNFIGIAFWFSPFMRDLIIRWQLAAELQCDAVALDGAKKEMRKAYAESLLLALRIPASEGVRTLVASFSTHHLRSEKMRIKTIMRGSETVRKGAAVTTGLILSGAFMLLAGTTGALALTAKAEIANNNSPIVEDGRVTSNYGIVRMVNKDGLPKMQEDANGKTLKPRFHNGVDIAAKTGTPVHAPAGGWVVAATDIYDGKPKYGKVVVIETPGGIQTLFSHLDSYAVTVGQAIQAGEKLAEIGNTGVSSGPHVHVEVFVNGERVDPATIWANLIG